MTNILDYKTLIFDCDGVLLNSNRIKTDAFYEATIAYGEQYAQRLVDYHVKNGGISRYYKFEYFLKEILCKEVTEDELNQLLNTFAEIVKEALIKCEIAPDLEKLRLATKDSKWLIVSGGKQPELRDVFQARGISHYFDGGIFGSPDTKDEILAREMKKLVEPGLFLGDSKYDYQAASNAGLDFLFISDWSEVSDWKSFCDDNDIMFVGNLSSLI